MAYGPTHSAAVTRREWRRQEHRLARHRVRTLLTLLYLVPTNQIPDSPLIDMLPDLAA
jgi:hypothetical protein